MSVCMRYTDSREEARDVLNVGFMKVFQNIGRYQPSHSLESWVRRIMINTSIDHYRKNKKHRHHLEVEHAYGEFDRSVVSPVSRLSEEEIMGMVQNLSPAYRTVFSLYVLEGFNHREIAERLGISEGTSKSNLAKARGKLQRMLAEELEYDRSPKRR